MFFILTISQHLSTIPGLELTILFLCKQRSYLPLKCVYLYSAEHKIQGFKKIKMLQALETGKMICGD